jgi:hypothetical protein
MRRRNRFSGKKNPVHLEEIFPSVDLSSILYIEEEREHSELFLGLYDENTIMDILTQTGIINILNKKGYYNLILTISKNESFVSRFYVNFDSLDRDTRLPGQVYPGLGTLRNMQEMLCIFANTTNSDAILDISEHYHGAVIYSEMYSFFSPIDGGRLKA